MKYFKELKKGDAFICLQTAYIKISDASASNAICLHNGNSITFCDEAGVSPIQLTYVSEGGYPLDFIISRR